MSHKCKARRDAKKAARMEEANTLIRAISSHGRRFFYCSQKQTIARFELIEGRIRFIDDFTGLPVHCLRNRKWRGFTHGGTLQRLVEKMIDYIRLGHKLPISIIAPPYLFDPVQTDIEQQTEENNIWGYPESEKKALLEKIKDMEIFQTE